MRKRLLLAAGLLLAASAPARDSGFGIDAFNRVVPASAAAAAAFSPLSFEIDSVLFAEAVDPIRRAIFAGALGVTDEFAAEYRTLARAPFENGSSNRFQTVWAHAFVVDEPRAIDPAFRLGIQETYGAEVCGARFSAGVEAWIRTLFSGAYDGWRLPALPAKDAYALHDLVSIKAEAAPSNGVRRALATHTVYRVPLLDGKRLYALVPKEDRPVSSVRARLSSKTLQDILSMDLAVVDPPEPVRVALPPIDIVATNELAGAFQYFKFPTAGLKPFPPGLHPAALRQTVRLRVKPAAPDPKAVPLEGPFLFFIHDPAANTVPVAGVLPGKGS